jgi:hypothetical protein
VGFVVDKVTLEQVFFRLPRLSSVSIIPSIGSYSFVYRKRYIISLTDRLVTRHT